MSADADYEIARRKFVKLGELSASDHRLARIAACLNFCRNIPTEWLEKHVATKTWANPYVPGEQLVSAEEIGE